MSRIKNAVNVMYKPHNYCDLEDVYYGETMTTKEANAIVDEINAQRKHMFSPRADAYDMANPYNFKRWQDIAEQATKSQKWRVYGDVDIKPTGFIIVITEPYDD